jgi:hypothetical protein
MTTELINDLISKLDQQHEDAISQRETAIGSNAEIFTKVNRNILDNQKYMNERKALVRLLNDITPVSTGVQDFLKPKVTEGKMDVLAGTTKEDTSLLTEGKPLGKQI